jgi:hypothetical protein
MRGRQRAPNIAGVQVCCKWNTRESFIQIAHRSCVLILFSTTPEAVLVLPPRVVGQYTRVGRRGSIVNSMQHATRLMPSVLLSSRRRGCSADVEMTSFSAGAMGVKLLQSGYVLKLGLMLPFINWPKVPGLTGVTRMIRPACANPTQSTGAGQVLPGCS